MRDVEAISSTMGDGRKSDGYSTMASGGVVCCSVVSDGISAACIYTCWDQGLKSEIVY